MVCGWERGKETNDAGDTTGSCDAKALRGGEWRGGGHAEHSKAEAMLRFGLRRTAKAERCPETRGSGEVWLRPAVLRFGEVSLCPAVLRFG